MNPGPLDGLVPKAWRPPVGPPPSPMGLVPTAMAPVVAPLMAPPTMTPQNFLSPPAAMPWGGEGSEGGEGGEGFRNVSFSSQF